MDQKELKREIGALKRRIKAAQKRYDEQLKRYLDTHLGATAESFHSNIPAHIEAMQQSLAGLEAELEPTGKRRRS